MKKMILLALWLWATTSGAHTLPISYLMLVPDGDYLHLELTLNPFDLNSAAGLDEEQQIRLNARQTGSKASGLAAQILDCLSIRANGTKIEAEVAGLTADPDSHHLTLRAHYRMDGRRANLSIESRLTSVMGVSHLTQVTCLRDGREQLAQLNGPAAIAIFRPEGVAQAVPGSRTGDDVRKTLAGTAHQPEGRGRALFMIAVVVVPAAGIALAMLLTGFLHRWKSGPDAVIKVSPHLAPQ
jgi:hypothetical protein